MATSSISRGRLRRLSELRSEHGRVLSVYVDLDPSEFATPAARSTQLNALLDEAERVVEATADLAHDERMALRDDIGRLRAQLDPVGLGAGGAQGIAIFASGPADLLEIVPLPYPVQSRVVVGTSPYVEPLASAGERERWCVALASRKDGRIFLGDEDGLEDLEERIRDDTHGQHRQGGWSNPRFQRGIEKEKDDHLERLAGRLMDTLRRTPFDRLAIGAPEPLDAEFEQRLHPYLRQLLAGRVPVDVENATAAEVLDAARPVFEAVQKERERALVERLRAGIGRPGGRAVAGIEDVRGALEQQAVEVLLLEPGASHEEEVERAIDQAADVVVLRHHPDLGPLGGIAALVRFPLATAL